MWHLVNQIRISKTRKNAAKGASNNAELFRRFLNLEILGLQNSLPLTQS